MLGWERSEIGGGFMGLWVYGKRGVMGGSSSEIGEEGEMGLWKEEYTSASDWGCLPRGFLT